MASLPQRERRPSFGPTVYHDEDVHVKRPQRVYYEEVSRDRTRRSSSIKAPAVAHSENTRYFVEPLEASMHGAARPIYADSPHDRPSQDDEKGFLERPSLTDDERPYKAESEFPRNTPYGQPRRSAVRYAPSPHPDYVVTEKSPLWWSRVRHSLREPCSEFFGVFILVLFGDGAIAQVVLSRNTRGDWQSICWGWGLGVMIGVYVSGISGSNINPAVTLTNCVFRKQAWRKLPVYAAAQILGAFTAAGVIYANYKSAIDAFEGGPGVRTVPGYSPNATAGIFATYPQPFMSRTGEFFSEFLCAAILMFCIYMLQDTKNMGAGKLLPLALFFVVFGIGACFGWETGFAINMARDFGPRLMTYCLGYGPKVWTASSNYFWIPMVAPFLGCLFGAWIHDLFLFTGESPVNTPWMGLRQLVRPRQAHHSPV